MSKMEVGEVAIASIEDDMKLLHPFNTPLTASQSPFILSQFDFEFSSLNSSDLVKNCF